MDRPVKSSAFSGLVSRVVSAARLGRAFVRVALRVALALLGLLALFAGCSSQCLRDDCQTSAPASAGATGAGAAGASTAGAGAPGGAPLDQKCTANAQCDSAQGESCVDGTCRLACHSHFDCGGYGECTSGADSDGSPGHFCLGHAQPAGQFYARCPSGTSADCDAARGFFCVSAGAADLDAYCTTDCTDDSSCAAGFACTPLNRPACAASCPNVPASPKDRSCIPSDQIGQGKPYQCGSRSVTRNACRPRRFCNSCDTDADCLASANQICAKDKSGAKICTQLCDLKHPSCPWGNAATCGVWDKDLGVATCAHRYGKCVGTGKGCEPCSKDADCGATGACTSSSFTGERWCVDLTVNCGCGSGAANTGLCAGGGCPKSPSGLEMRCVDSTPMTANSGVCVGANTGTGLLAASSPQIGCWPAK